VSPAIWREDRQEWQLPAVYLSVGTLSPLGDHTRSFESGELVVWELKEWQVTADLSVGTLSDLVPLGSLPVLNVSCRVG
jgi:hypothetical protein